MNVDAKEFRKALEVLEKEKGIKSDIVYDAFLKNPNFFLDLN